MHINTNIAALNAYRNLTNTDNRMNRSLERLSSGLKVNNAAEPDTQDNLSLKINSAAEPGTLDNLSKVNNNGFNIENIDESRGLIVNTQG